MREEREREREPFSCLMMRICVYTLLRMISISSSFLFCPFGRFFAAASLFGLSRLIKGHQSGSRWRHRNIRPPSSTALISSSPTRIISVTQLMEQTLHQMIAGNNWYICIPFYLLPNLFSAIDALPCARHGVEEKNNITFEEERSKRLIRQHAVRKKKTTLTQAIGQTRDYYEKMCVAREGLKRARLLWGGIEIYNKFIRRWQSMGRDVDDQI